MFHDTELTLKSASKSDYLIAMMIAYLLVVIAALLSSNAVLLISVNSFCFICSYHYYQRLNNRAEATSRVFRMNIDGNMLLEQRPVGVSADVPADIIAGSLSGSQWCSRYMAILRYKTAGRIGHLVILKSWQRPEQFRQLSVWLRQNSRNEGRQRT